MVTFLHQLTYWESWHANLFFEVLNQCPHALNQLFLTLPEGHLLVFDWVNFWLVLFHVFSIAFLKCCQRRSLLCNLCITIHLRQHVSFLNCFKFLFEFVVNVFNSFFLLLKLCRCGKHCKFFLFHFKGKLFTYLSKFFFEIYIIFLSFLRLIG